MSSALATRIAEEFSAGTEASTHPQRQAMQALTERGLPTSRDENWKYVNLRPLEKVRFAPAANGPQAAVTAQDLPAPVAQYARYTFIDGVFAPALSAPTTNAGVLVRSMKAVAATSAPTHPLLTPDLRFALLNEAFATDGALIQVEPGTQCRACIELVFVATAEAKAGASYPRLNLQVGAGAQVGSSSGTSASAAMRISSIQPWMSRWHATPSSSTIASSKPGHARSGLIR